MILECSGLSVGYGKKEILGGVTFGIHPGEAVALLGPNGGGKSTLLRTLAGLMPALGGQIKLLGDDLAKLSPKEVATRIAFVPQEELWQFAFSVEEIVAMGRLPISNGYFDSDEDRYVAEKAMEEAGCIELRQRRVTELSGGEHQRVLIARALAQGAPILFLDEPTAHLDPKFQVSTASLVRDLVGAGKSVLMALHDLPIAAAMADRGMLVHSGRATPVMEIGALLDSPELDEAYATPFDRIVTTDGRRIVLPRINATS